MPAFERYWKFMQRHILAILTAIASLFSTLAVTYGMIPQWVTPIVTFTTLIVGSLFVFRREEKQTASKLLNELIDFSNTFHSLTMAGSSEDRETQIRFLLDRVSISDKSQKDTLQIRVNYIKTCHNLIEKWFKCYKDEIEFFLNHPKSIDVANTIRLVNEFKEVVSNYMDNYINPSIDFINDVKSFPKDLKERFESKFDTFKIKYNHSMNQFNDYIKRLNKELSYQMDGVSIISTNLELESEKP